MGRCTANVLIIISGGRQGDPASSADVAGSLGWCLAVGLLDDVSVVVHRPQSLHPPGIESVGGDSVGAPRAVTHGEEDVGGLGLRTGRPAVVAAPHEVRVLEVDRRISVCAWTHHDDAGGVGRTQVVVQSEGESEVAETVRRQLQFPALTGHLPVREGHDAGMGDKDVERSLPSPCHHQIFPVAGRMEWWWTRWKTSSRFLGTRSHLSSSQCLRRGACRLTVAGAGEPIQLTEGDCYLLTQAREFTLPSDADAVPVKAACRPRTGRL